MSATAGWRKVERTAIGFIQQSVQNGESLSGVDRRSREPSTWGEAAVETPREEDGLFGLVEVWEMAAVVGHMD